MSYILAAVVAVLWFAADQWTKCLVVKNFELGTTKSAIDGLFDFTYIHNKGGAWGMLEGYTWLLLAVTVLAMLVCIAMIAKSGKKNKLLFWSVCLILSGGLGNMIDRIFRDGNVVDFIRLQFIDFPIFNIADCAVCIGAALLIVYFIIDFKNSAKQKSDVKVPDEITEE